VYLAILDNIKKLKHVCYIRIPLNRNGCPFNSFGLLISQIKQLNEFLNA